MIYFYGDDDGGEGRRGLNAFRMMTMRMQERNEGA
jgi:hypothetical protein